MPDVFEDHKFISTGRSEIMIADREEKYIVSELEPAQIKNISPERSGSRWSILLTIAQICSIITITLGMLGLAGWISGVQDLARLQASSIVMAPSTGIAFCLLGTVLLSQTRVLKISKQVMGTAALLVVSLGILILLHVIGHMPFDIERLLVAHIEMHGKVPAWRMSPVTAAGFLLCGLSLFLLNCNRMNSLSAMLASITFSDMLVVVLGYLYGTPLLYGGLTIPTAFPTAVAFLSLTIGIIALVGPAYFPLRPFAGSSARALLLRSFLPLTVASILVTSLFYQTVPHYLRVNYALLSALSLLASSAALSVVVTMTARVIGGTIDRTEAQRSAAEEALRQAHHELELRVATRTAELNEANARLMTLATTDGLTGLHNHRTFQERLVEECSRATRYPASLTLVLLDVDKFKEYNDTFGHPAGDEVLKTVARLLKETARGTDFVARYGGEEFAVLLPNTDYIGAMTMAERFRAIIEESACGKRPITISLGTASFDHTIKDASHLIRNADQALYNAKRAGRNRVIHYVEPQ